jgi:DNA-binding NarL/FixJ family response regulator
MGIKLVAIYPLDEVVCALYESQPDIIIINDDHELKAQDVLKSLRQACRSVRAIVISPSTEFDYVRGCFLLGASDYLRRMPQPIELMDSIIKFMSMQSSVDSILLQPETNSVEDYYNFLKMFPSSPPKNACYSKLKITPRYPDFAVAIISGKVMPSALSFNMEICFTTLTIENTNTLVIFNLNQRDYSRLPLELPANLPNRTIAISRRFTSIYNLPEMVSECLSAFNTTFIEPEKKLFICSNEHEKRQKSLNRYIRLLNSYISERKAQEFYAITGHLHSLFLEEKFMASDLVVLYNSIAVAFGIQYSKLLHTSRCCRFCQTAPTCGKCIKALTFL